MVDEAMNDELCRDDADERHVVGDAERRAFTAFVDQPLDGWRVKDSVALQPRGGEQFVDVVAVRCEEDLRARGAVWLL